jgi:hypothetical protein
MGCNGEPSAGEGSGSGDLRRRKGGWDGAGASSSFAEGTWEFVLSSMDERFSGSVDADGFPTSRREGSPRDLFLVICEDLGNAEFNGAEFREVKPGVAKFSITNTDVLYLSSIPWYSIGRAVTF